TAMPAKGYFGFGTYQVPLGGYSFQLPEDNFSWYGFDVEINFESTIITNEKDDFMGWIDILQRGEGDSLEDQVARFRADIIYENPEVEPIDNPYPLWVDDFEGRQQGFYYEGELIDSLIDWIVLDVGHDRFLTIQLVLHDAPFSERSRENYAQLREQILDSFYIYDPIYVSPADCPVSDDPTYGYSVENPIFVGGGNFQSIDWKSDYFHNLLGPNQELVSWDRLRSFTYGDLVLDEYRVSYEGLEEPLTLFVNTGRFAPLSAPMGFTCKQPFPQTEP
ncbi:MAG: hypothetical protein H0S79_21500, partial [Anaerolineaceae bacterium]|nr:hypothetical protein [Anaerolineaceae bacterium]